MNPPTVPVLKEFTPGQLRWLSDELGSPVCHSPLTRKDVTDYLAGLLPPAQAASLKKLLRSNAELRDFVARCQADIPESVERVKQRVGLLARLQPLNPELVPRLRLLAPPAEPVIVTGKVTGGISSLKELPAAASQVKASFLVKELEVLFPAFSQPVHLEVYLSVREGETAGLTHRFTVSLPADVDAADLAKLKRWCLVCGTLELPLSIGSTACDASTMESVLDSTAWCCKMNS